MDNSQNRLYIVILAGGSGTRLWPRSRQAVPKHLLDLISERSMLQETFERIRPLAAPDHVLVVTSETQKDLVCRQLPEVPAENVIAEPQGRNTGPAIGLAALHLRRRDPGAVMASLHSDHFIRRGDLFCQALRVAVAVAEQGYLVTLGIEPAHAETGYGYIHRDELIGEIQGWPAYRVGRFVEKPKADVAERMVESGDYYWNAGIFVWRVQVLLDAFARYAPQLSAPLTALDQTLNGAAGQAAFAQVWATLPKEPIDTAVMEKAERVAVVPANVGWSDVGSWRTLQDLAPPDKDGNVFVGDHIALQTKHTYIYSPKKLVAVIGVSDLIVVDTGDALLICPADKTQQVKDIVDELKRQNKDQYL